MSSDDATARSDSEKDRKHPAEWSAQTTASSPTETFSAVKKSLSSPENEMRRWRKTFESNAKEINGNL